MHGKDPKKVEATPGKKEEPKDSQAKVLATAIENARKNPVAKNENENVVRKVVIEVVIVTRCVVWQRLLSTLTFIFIKFETFNLIHFQVD